MIREWKMLSVMMLGVVLAAGCASTKPMTAATPIQEFQSPDWVRKGSGAFGSDKGKVFYGVGAASGIQNPSLLRTTADNRARNDLAKIFQFYTASLMKDYMGATTANKPGVSSEEQLIEQAMKTVSGMTLSGVEIVDHWQNPATAQFFSLARLDLSAFKDSLEKAKELDEKTKEYIRKNSDRLHEKLEKEEMKVSPGN
jgi:hypothetical protein